MTMISQLLAVSEAYRTAKRLSSSRVSTLVFGDGKVLPELARSQRDITTGRLEAAIQWFSDHWPAGATWPAGIVRPAPQPAEPANGDAPAAEPAA